MRSIAVTIATILGLGISHMAQAGPLSFSFSFTNTPQPGGVTGGVVTGIVSGLTDNATGAASDLVLTSYPSELVSASAGHLQQAPLDLFAASGWQVLSNSFTVANGQVTSANFDAQLIVTLPHSPPGQIDFGLADLGHGDPGSFYVQVIGQGALVTDLNTSVGYLALQETQGIPEPGTMPMLCAGILALVAGRGTKPRGPGRSG